MEMAKQKTKTNLRIIELIIIIGMANAEKWYFKSFAMQLLLFFNSCLLISVLLMWLFKFLFFVVVCSICQLSDE
jgi:hypothetical protein